jgi:hypothetical protein
MDRLTTYPKAVAAELRAQMARQQRSIAELGEALGLRDRKSAKVRYDGTKSLTLEEVELAAAWLGIDRDLLFDAEAVAS